MNSLIDRARIEADRIEAANEESRKILLLQQDEAAKKLLGGGGQAPVVPSKPKEELAIEYANAWARGERGNVFQDIEDDLAKQ